MRRKYYLDCDNWITYQLANGDEFYVTTSCYNQHTDEIGFYLIGALWSAEAADPVYYACDPDIAFRCAEVFQP